MIYVSNVEDLPEGNPILVPGSNVVAAESAVHYTTRAPESNVIAAERAVQLPCSYGSVDLWVQGNREGESGVLLQGM